MKLLINEKNEIESYSIWGDIEGAIDFTGTVPDDFLIKFVPYFYLFKDDKIIENPDYVAPSPDVIGPTDMQTILKAMASQMADHCEAIDKLDARIGVLENVEKQEAN